MLRLNLNAMKATLGTQVAATVALCMLGVSLADANPRPGTVVAWGDNSHGQTNVPTAALTNVVAVAGSWQSFALKADGTVVGWGDGFTLTNIPSTVSNAIAISCGAFHCLALRSNGTVIAWGDNQFGQTSVIQGMVNVVKIACGGGHSLALQADGTLYTWGQYFNGSSFVPMFVPPSVQGVASIAGAGYCSMALRSNGTVVVWGYGGNGQTNVPTGLTNVMAIAGSGSGCLALRLDGTVVGWPGSAPPGLTNVVAIACGNHNLALRSDGTVIAWGQSSTVPEDLRSVVAIGSGNAHDLAVSLVPVVLSQQFASISLAAGASTNLTIQAWNASALAYQWFFDDAPIIGETATNLTINDFNFAKAGTYSVIISNEFGSTAARSVLRLPNSPLVLVNDVDVGGGKVDRVDSALISMSNTGTGAAIFFTFDGSAPDFTDIPYTGPFSLTNSATIRAIAYNSNYTDSAEAAAITVQVWPTYPLAATTPGGGSVGVSPSAYSAGNRYVSNTVVTLTATPASGWSFLNWTGDSASTSNVTTVLLDRPRAVQAVFGTSLNLFTNGNGHVLLNPATGPYAFGSPVQLTALPAAGSYFFGWAGATGGFVNPLFLKATNAAGITALFGTLNPNQVSLTVLPNGNGSVSVSPSRNVYTNGETVTLTAVPGANRVFTGWSGGASGNLNPLGVTLTASTVITASFAPGAPTNPPVITQPPLSRTLGAGASTLLSFGLTGDGPFTYQWRLNGSPVSGATNPMLGLSGVTPAQAGRYDVVVSGASGSATSAPASVALFGLEMAQSGGQSQPLLVLDCASGASFRLEHSWNLALTNWSLLAPVTLGGSRLYFVDTPDTNYFRRFYRAVPQ